MNHWKTTLGLIATASTLLTVAGCGTDVPRQPRALEPSRTVHSTTHPASTVTVQMGNMAFNPVVLHVTPGTTVVWNNNDTMAHTVTSGANRTKDRKFDSADLQPGHKFSYTFTRTGTYQYYCVYHPNMNATVIVRSSQSTNVSNGMSMGTPSNTATATKYSIAPLGTGTAAEPLQPDGLRILPYTVENGYKVFHLTAKPVWWQVKPGQKVEAWAFNGSVPGPEIRVNQGDKVKILVRNGLPEGTSVHWHGLDVPFSQDGVGGLSQPDIKPGQTWTYTFKVTTPPGTYMYHSHPMKDMLRQEEMGLYGPFIVEPDGTTSNKIHQSYQDEFTLMLNDSSQFGYTINGKSFPATPVLPVKLGDKVLVHLINNGDMDHPMHLHGFHFQLLAQDGYPLAAPQTLDTITTEPGSTYDLAFTADKPGEWLFHCHILPHVTSGTDMSGMITLFNVK